MTRERLRFLLRPPGRTIAGGLLVLAIFFGTYALWQPGRDVRDGRHDRFNNGIWLSHGWLGDENWFIRNQRTNQLSDYHDAARLRALKDLLAAHHIKDLFPHLCPADEYGKLPAIDAVQTERFLTEFQGFRVIPWIGGPAGPTTRIGDAKWRAGFIRSITNLFAMHPAFAGVQLNIEPLTSGDENFLKLLEEVRAALPQGKILSVAAYPPPTRWQPFPDVHWDETYFRAVARRCDQLAVMMYDTGIRVPKVYEHTMGRWTRELLAWSGGKQVLLGLPTYEDAGVEYHDPKVENLRTALLGIHKALDNSAATANYQGVSLYCEWETDPAEWQYFEQHFLKH